MIALAVQYSSWLYTSIYFVKGRRYWYQARGETRLLCSSCPLISSVVTTVETRRGAGTELIITSKIKNKSQSFHREIKCRSDGSQKDFSYQIIIFSTVSGMTPFLDELWVSYGSYLKINLMWLFSSSLALQSSCPALILSIPLGLSPTYEIILFYSLPSTPSFACWLLVGVWLTCYWLG